MFEHMQITLINSKHSSDITGKSRFGTNRPTFQTEIIQNEFVKQAATLDKFVVCKSFTTYCTYRPYGEWIFTVVWPAYHTE